MRAACDYLTAIEVAIEQHGSVAAYNENARRLAEMCGESVDPDELLREPTPRDLRQLHRRRRRFRHDAWGIRRWQPRPDAFCRVPSPRRSRPHARRRRYSRSRRPSSARSPGRCSSEPEPDPPVAVAAPERAA